MQQWFMHHEAQIQAIIAEEVERARLIHKIIQNTSVDSFTRGVYIEKPGKKGRIKDCAKQIPLIENREPVFISRLQMDDPNFEVAEQIIRRAANRIARQHDKKCFDRIKKGCRNTQKINGNKGKHLVAVIAGSVGDLEAKGFVGSYCLVLGQDLFVTATLDGKKQIEAMLGKGTMHRSTLLDKSEALFFSLNSKAMDRFVAVAPRLEFLRNDADGNPECRLFERFQLRLNDPNSVIRLMLKK